MNNLTYILTIDIGTSSTRAVLCDARANSLAEGIVQLPNELESAPDGTAVFDGPAFFDTIIQVIDGIHQKIGTRAEQIAAVSIASMVSNIMGVDANGTIQTPLFIYADTRSRDDAQVLRDELGSTGLEESHNRTGCILHTSYMPPRFLWLARTQHQLLKASTYWMSIGEYLQWQLLGQRAVSYSVASWTGLLNRHTLCWDETWLDRLPLDEEQLSPLTDVDQPMQGLQPQWAERWPALQNVLWFPAVGDGAAANLGSGCDNPHCIALTIGTTGAMRVVVEPTMDVVPDGLWLYRVDGKRGLLGGATTEGGNLFGWFHEILKLPPDEQLNQELAQLPPAAHGLTLLPFIAGERAPGWNDNARPTLHGFNLQTQPIEIMQAALESVAYRFALIYERLKPHLAGSASENHQIIASGGALLRSVAWLQIMADVLNEPVVALAEREITVRGLALLALEQLGMIESCSALPPTTGRVYEPDGGSHEIHQGALARQVGLYGRVFAP